MSGDWNCASSVLQNLVFIPFSVPYTTKSRKPCFLENCGPWHGDKTSQDGAPSKVSSSQSKTLITLWGSRRAESLKPCRSILKTFYQAFCIWKEAETSNAFLFHLLPHDVINFTLSVRECLHLPKCPWGISPPRCTELTCHSFGCCCRRCCHDDVPKKCKARAAGMKQGCKGVTEVVCTLDFTLLLCEQKMTWGKYANGFGTNYLFWNKAKRFRCESHLNVTGVYSVSGFCLF